MLPTQHIRVFMFLKKQVNVGLTFQNACVATLKNIFVVPYVNLFMMTFSDHVVKKYSIK